MKAGRWALVEQMNPLEGVGETGENWGGRSGTDQSRKRREVEEPLFFETPSREVEEPLFCDTPSPGPYEGSRRNSVINLGPSRSLVH